jgi:hypothetical protein
MNTKLGLFALPVLLFAGVAQAAPCTSSTPIGVACVVDFGDRSGQSFFQTSGWEVGFAEATGFAGFASVGALSNSSYVAHNFGGLSAPDASTFSISGGQLFNLESFVIANGVGTQTVTFTGYGSDGAVKYTQNIDLTTTAISYSFVDAGGNPVIWTDLSSFSITAQNLPSQQSFWALNDISVTAVPEPETYAMLLAGLGLVSVVARIRRKDRA